MRMAYARGRDRDLAPNLLLVSDRLDPPTILNQWLEVTLWLLAREWPQTLYLIGCARNVPSISLIGNTTAMHWTRSCIALSY